MFVLLNMFYQIIYFIFCDGQKYNITVVVQSKIINYSSRMSVTLYEL